MEQNDLNKKIINSASFYFEYAMELYRNDLGINIPEEEYPRLYIERN